MSDFCEYEWSAHRDLNIIKKNQQSNENMKKYDKKFNFNYNEVTERTLALNKLKELIGASIDLALKDKSLCNDDDFLLRFLYARKFSIEEAFKLIINYNLYRQRNKILLKNLTSLDENIQMSLRDGFPGVLTERDRRGRKVLVFFTANWDYRLYSLVTIYRALLLSLEKLLEDKQNQANGFVAIVDWTNFTLRQSTHLNPKILKLMIESLQDCFPVRFKAIHFIGQPWYVEAALAVIRPFLKDKTSARIKLHGSNLSTLHEFVARDILPPELGGEGITFNPLTWVHTLLESSQLPSNKLETCTYFITQKTIYSKTLPTLTINTNVNNNGNDNEDTDNDDIDDEKETLQHNNRNNSINKKSQQNNKYVDNDNNEKNNNLYIKFNNLNNNNNTNNNNNNINNLLKNTNKSNDPAKNMLLSFNNDDI